MSKLYNFLLAVLFVLSCLTVKGKEGAMYPVKADMPMAMCTNSALATSTLQQDSPVYAADVTLAMVFWNPAYQKIADTDVTTNLVLAEECLKGLKMPPVEEVKIVEETPESESVSLSGRQEIQMKQGTMPEEEGNETDIMKAQSMTSTPPPPPIVGMTTFYTNTTTPLVSNTSCSATKSITIDGWLMTISTTSNCGFNWTNSTGGDGRIQYLVGFGSLTQGTFGSDDGSEFALKNLSWGVSTSSWTARPMQFVGYKNGVAVPGATLNATTPAGTGILNTQVVDFTGNPNFGDVDDVWFTYTGGGYANTILFFEDITTGLAVAACTTPTLTLDGSTNVSCNGGSNGTASVTASGGTPYTYTWSPSGGNGAVATGLSAGIYTCVTTNSCGLTASATATITQPAALSTATAVTNVACNGGSNGVAAISGFGGAGGYSYLWNTGATTSAITGKMSGVYTATVTDANGCKASKSAVITQPSALVTTTAVTTVACNGGSNGSATITASGGAGSYSYLWSNGASTSAITGVMAGVYTATVTDANSCTSIKSAVITQPSALVTTTAVTTVACNGGSNGSATITASGGTGGYTYLWSNGASTSAITGLMAGVYTATVTDANSCTSIKSAVVTQPTALVTTTALTTVACNGGSNGSATITASGGAGSYTYLWSDGSSTSAITGKTFGVYTATVTDANSCTSIKSANITQPNALVTTTAVTMVACNGGSNGSATITASGGAGGYSYLWSSGATTSAITGKTFGVYTATVTDANSCTSIKSANITQPSALVTTTAVTNVACNGGSNGSATITASGGAGSYSYLWSNGAGTSAITGVMAGVYTATVTDANSCTSIKSVNITQPTALVTTTAVTTVACNGGSNGSATITATDGAGSYTYLWSNGASTSAITGLMAGVYTATVTDANSCTSIKSAIVTQPSALVTTTAVTNVACNGGSNGSATITSSGGTSSYTYLWSNGASTSAITGLLPGVYTATVTDVNSCTSIKSVNVTQPSALVTATAAINVSCNGGSNGTASIGAFGGTGSYTYLWSNGATTAAATGVMAGVYSATVTDANSCTSSKTVTITEPSAMVTTTTAINASCNGGSNGSATITATGGAGAYTYLWSNGASTSTITGVMAGVYTATVTDANSCTSIKSVNITQPTAIVTTTAATSPSCNGSSNGSATITATGGTGAYTYLWNTGATTSAISGLIAGAYTATVTDANSCTGIKTITVTQPLALLTSTAVTNVSCNGGSNGSATITATGGTGAYTYLWSNGASTSATTGLLQGVYSATVTDANNCISTKVISITQPSAIVTATASINVSCNGGSNGTASIGAFGGTGTYTYLWSNGATTAAATGVMAGVYSATVTDANGCTSSKSVTITEPSALTTSITATNVLCNGGVGSATITATGGTTGYTYLWNNGATASTVSGVLAGAYTATVTDANNCKSIKTITITQPSPVTLTAIANNTVVCSGSSSTLTATGSGGTGAMTYSWVAGPTNNVNIVNPVSITIYTVNVADVNNCTKSATVSVATNALPIITVNSGTVCNGNSFTLLPGGASTYTFSGGTAVVSPTITSSYSVTGTSAAGCLSSNTAVSTVTVSTCSLASALNFDGVDDYVENTAPAMPAMNAFTFETWIKLNNVTNAKIFSSGQIELAIISGQLDLYTPSFNATNPTAVPTGIWKHVAVTYNGSNLKFYIDGVQGSTFPASGAIGANTGFKIGKHVSANCCLLDGSLDEFRIWNVERTQCEINTFKNCEIPSTATGLVANYHFNQGFDSNPNPTVTSLTDASGNVNTGTLKNFGLTTSTSNWISPGGVVSGFITPLTLPTSTISSTNVLCNGGNGTAVITASAGTPAYTYAWSNAATTSTISAVAGVYTATVTDANKCISVRTATITQPAVLTSTISSANVLCNGGNGTATVTAGGGTGAYTYAWSNAATTSTISAIAGVYTATVTDANLCTSTKTITLTQPASLTLTAVANNTVICSGNSSTLTATGSGGTGAITYLWIAGPTTSLYVVSPVTSTIYTVNATDANTCTKTATVTIAVNITPTISVNSGAICSGNSFTMVPTGASTYTYSSGSAIVSPLVNTTYSVTGTSAQGCVSFNTAVSSVTVNASPVVSVNSGAICSGESFTMVPTGASTYTYSSGSAIVSPLVNTTYSVTGTSALGCVSSNTAVSSVTVNALPSLSITVSTPSVCLGNSSVLTAGGAATYTWSTGSNAAAITVAPAIATTYTLTGTNTTGCVNMKTQTIGIFPSPAINVSSSSASVCAGFSSTLTASGVSTYTWSTGSNNAIVSVTPSAATTYSVIGTDMNGCTATNSITIGISSKPVLVATTTSTGVCNGTSATLNVSGATSYFWSTGTGGASVNVSPSSSTIYTVTGTNGAGCVSSTTIAVVVYVSPTISLGSDIEVGAGVNYQFNPTQTGAVTYTWSPATYLSSSSILNPVATPENDITYVLTVTSANGCLASDTIKVSVLKDLIIANYMSPNGDGQNDTWKVSLPFLIKDYSVTIIDSYGKTVYDKASNYNNEFDGKQGGDDLPDGVYYYFIKQGSTTKYKGSITLTK